MCAFLGLCFSGITLVCACVFGQEGMHYWVHVSLVLCVCLFTTHDNSTTHLCDSAGLLYVDYVHTCESVGWYACILCVTVCTSICDCQCLYRILSVCAWAVEICAGVHDLVVLCVLCWQLFKYMCAMYECLTVWGYSFGSENHSSQIITRVGRT